MKVIDACGLACPQPVIKTKKALDKLEDGSIVTIVDNEIALKNVEKLATKMGFKSNVKRDNNLFHITISKNEATQSTISNKASLDTSENEGGTVIFCASDKFGEGDQALSDVLVKGFFYAFTQHNTPPKAIVFMNKGIMLALKSSPVLESLIELAEQGCEILSCGTCLDYYQKKELLGVGDITNMYTATEILSEASRIIRI